MHLAHACTQKGCDKANNCASVLSERAITIKYRQDAPTRLCLPLNSTKKWYGIWFTPPLPGVFKRIRMYVCEYYKLWFEHAFVLKYEVLGIPSRLDLFEHGQPAASANTETSLIHSGVQAEGDHMVQSKRGKETCYCQTICIRPQASARMVGKGRSVTQERNRLGKEKEKTARRWKTTFCRIGQACVQLCLRNAPWGGLSLTGTFARKPSNAQRNWVVQSFPNVAEMLVAQKQDEP